MKDRADVAKQSELTRTLAAEADTIFIGEVIAIDETGGNVTVRAERVLKGSVVAGPVVLRYPGPKGLVVSCYFADMFQNTQMHTGRSYILYLQDGVLLRAGWTERSLGSIPLRREIKIARSVASGT